MRFLHPEIAWWLVALLAATFVARAAARRRLGVAMTSPWVFDRTVPASIVRHAPAGVILTGLLLLGCALMDPVTAICRNRGPIARARYRDRVGPLFEHGGTDGSSSGAGGDPASGGHEFQRRRPPPPSKTRLEATRDAIKTFVGRRVDDRIGLVVFSDNAYVVSPLTFDHRYLVRYIDMVDNQILRGEGMTAIGEGLALSTDLLARQAVVPGDGTR